MAVSVGTCPPCKGTGRAVRPPSEDGQVSAFPQLCSRCQGSGRAVLTKDELKTDFTIRGYRDQDKATARSVPSGGNRPFVSGIEDIDALRRRRDEIRKGEGRPAPPCEPKPDPSVTDSVTEPVTDHIPQCPCGRESCCGSADQP